MHIYIQSRLERNAMLAGAGFTICSVVTLVYKLRVGCSLRVKINGINKRGADRMQDIECECQVHRLD